MVVLEHRPLAAFTPHEGALGGVGDRDPCWPPLAQGVREDLPRVFWKPCRGHHSPRSHENPRPQRGSRQRPRARNARRRHLRPRRAHRAGSSGWTGSRPRRQRKCERPAMPRPPPLLDGGVEHRGGSSRKSHRPPPSGGGKQTVRTWRQGAWRCARWVVALTDAAAGVTCWGRVRPLSDGPSASASRRICSPWASRPLLAA